MSGKKYLNLGLIALVLCFGPASRAGAETPKVQLQGTIERVMELLRTIRSVNDIEKTKPLFRQILLPRFDFAEMARRSLGSRWSDLKEREGEFVSAFTQMIEGSFMGSIGSYRGEKIVYGRERVDREFAEVDTQVVGGQQGALEVDYRLHLVGGDWMVYDVLIDQVSLVSNFRSQFTRVLHSASLEELIRRLREKASGNRS